MISHSILLNCISGRDFFRHIFGSECAVGQADRATVWMEHTCSRTHIWSTLQHRLAQIQTGECRLCVCACECPPFSVFLHCIDVPCPIVWPLCAWVAVVSSRRASWRWCPQVSVVRQVLLWWCHQMVSQGRLPECSQGASSPAGQPW